MNFQELEQYLKSIPEKVSADLPEIVAETATEYFKESFSVKEFDGKPWPQPKSQKRTGSLMISSGALLNSIRPTVVSPELVRISAGNEKVPYARAHNEGVNEEVVINPFKRRDGTEVKGHSRAMNLPQRQFMGRSNELAKIIHDRVSGYIKDIL
jgi:Phage virion morphogenesis family.